MKTTLKLPLKPTKEQEAKFIKFANVSRFVYNWGLSEKKKAYEENKENLKLQDLITRLQYLKYEVEGYSWITEVPESVTKQALKDLMTAYTLFFKRGNSGFPKFKSKKNTSLSFYQRTDNLYFVESKSQVNITGVGKVKVNNHYGWFPAKVENPRIKFDGKCWYLTVACEQEEKHEVLSDVVLGIDLGLKTLAVCSNGMEIQNVNKSKRVKQLEKRLKHLQRKVSKKYEMNKQGTKYVKTDNIKKLEEEINLLHRKLINIRNTHIHQATADIVKTKPCKLVVEDLNIKGMMKNRHLSKAIQKAEFNKFQTYLSYKCERNGIEFEKADRWYASSKLCSCCGNKKQDLKLKDRTYICIECGLVIDRDLNAAINLSRYEKVK